MLHISGDADPSMAYSFTEQEVRIRHSRPWQPSVMTPSGSVYRPFGCQAKAKAISPQQIPVMFSVGSDKLNNYGHSWRTNDE